MKSNEPNVTFGNDNSKLYNIKCILLAYYCYLCVCWVGNIHNIATPSEHGEKARGNLLL